MDRIFVADMEDKRDTKYDEYLRGADAAQHFL